MAGVAYVYPEIIFLSELSTLKSEETGHHEHLLNLLDQLHNDEHQDEVGLKPLLGPVVGGLKL